LLQGTRAEEWPALAFAVPVWFHSIAEESPPDSVAMPARSREDGWRRLCRRDVAGDAAKAAKRGWVVEHKGLCTKGAEKRGQAIDGEGDDV